MKKIQLKQLLLLTAATICLNSCGGSDENTVATGKQYELYEVCLSDHQLETEYPASIQGRQDIRIIPRVDGYLQEIKVKEGDKVQKGQLLFVIDQAAYVAAVKSANASVLQTSALLSKSEQDYESRKILREKNIISDFDLIQAKNDLEVAKANKEAAVAALEAAQNNLSYTELRSPSDGVIGKIPYRKGDYVGPSTQDGLTVVADNKMMYVYFSMTETKVMDYLFRYANMQEAIRNMPKIKLELPGGRIYDQEGEVESVSGIVDEHTGSVSVRAVFPNADGRLLSGGTGCVLIPAVTENAMVIPQKATYELQDKIYVVKVVDGKAVSKIIEVEPVHDGLNYVVTKGLEKGEVIVAKGAGLVRDGDLIQGEIQNK